MSDTRIFTAKVRISDSFVESITATTEPLSDPPSGRVFVPMDSYHPEYGGWTYSNGVFTPPTP